MNSYIKLYGPSIDKGYEALIQMMESLGTIFKYGDMVSHIVSTIDPNMDLRTGRLISRGLEVLGEYDFIIEWKENPSLEQVRGLMKHIDEALLYTGCRYTITTQ
ncbi:MAG: hypothetical protein GWN62_08205 [Aliifodinibius sp.]|nr:hypothetical protein [Fodinibius sp.]